MPASAVSQRLLSVLSFSLATPVLPQSDDAIRKDPLSLPIHASLLAATPHRVI